MRVDIAFAGGRFVMPMPGWWRQLNKRFFNPRAMRSDHNWSVITHVGRKSGVTYKTPVEALPVDGGFAVFLVYGRNTDWSKNLLASGHGKLEKAGRHYTLSHPRIVQLSEVEAELPANNGRPPAFLRVNELLRVDAHPE